MEYPKNGSVVIVDDRIDDVEDLIIAFSQKNVPTYYFTGKQEKLHRNLDNIKLIFLDAAYTHNEQAMTATKADYMLQIVVNLINENAGDYIIVVWSTTAETFATELEERIHKLHAINHTLPPDKKIYKLPKKILGIKKGDVKDSSGNFDLIKINQEINSAIDDNDILNLSIAWENNVLDAAKNVLRNFKSVAPSDLEQKHMFALFAKAITEKGSLTESNIINPSLLPISTLLTDQLASFNNNKEELNSIGTELLSMANQNNPIDVKKASKINTFYHVDSNPSESDTSPGTVFNYKEYMSSNSCSSKNCTTKWAEDLIEKVENKFNGTDITKDLYKLFATKKEELKKLRFPYTSSKDYNSHLKIASSRGIDLNSVLSQFDPKFLESITSDEKKVFIEKYSKNQDLLYINELIKFVFNNDIITSNIIEHLNNLSGQCDFKSISIQNQEALLEKYYKDFSIKKFNDDFNSKKIPIFLEFSPDCDFVQKNRKKLRLIFGIMYPYGINVKDKKNFNGENFIYTPIIEYKGIPYKIVLDLHTVTGINEEAFIHTKPMYRFRKELLVDIQQKIASHIARPGFFNMNDYLA